MRVTVPGAPSRTDVGFQAVTDESAEGHETAFKGAVTDALKRVLGSFGDRFGNGLYTGSSPAQAGDPPASPQRGRQRDSASSPGRERSGRSRGRSGPESALR